MAATKAVLIIGGSGFIGTHLCLRLREGFKVFATYHEHQMRIPGVTFLPYSLSNRNWVKRVVYTARPDVIIYAAGDHRIESAESDAREADRVHTHGPATVLNVGEIMQPKFIYLSSAYAFEGTKGNYHETDTILPANALGKAKVGGENFIRGKSLNYILLRTSPLFGRGNGFRLSFLDKLRMKLDRGQRVELPANEVHSFASIHAFSDFMIRLVDSGPRNKVLHYGGLTKCTHYDFAREFARRFGYDPSLVIQRRARDEFASSDFSLNSTQVAETLKIKPLLLEEGFDLIEKQLVPRL